MTSYRPIHYSVKCPECGKIVSPPKPIKRCIVDSCGCDNQVYLDVDPSYQIVSYKNKKPDRI